MRTSITIRGDAQIIESLKTDTEKVANACIDAVNNGLVILENSMKKDCPVNTDPNDTSTIRLKESIKILQPAKRYKKTVVGKVGPEKKTAMHVEFGTANMHPRIFMRIQLPKHKNTIRNAARNIIKGALGL